MKEKVSPHNLRLKLRDSSGFTLVEIIVALALTGIVMVSIYKAFSGQQRIYSIQEQAVEMQENLRASIDVMVRDIRHAGLDPLGTAGAGFLVATANTVQFTMDITGGEDDNIDNDGNGDEDESSEFFNGNVSSPGEDLTYSLFTESGVQCLGRDSGGGFVAIARNVDAVEFRYTLANNTQTLAPGSLDDIRMVTVSVLVRNPVEDANFLNDTVYTMPSGATVGPFGDRSRRRLLTTTVRCRNMGFR